jgi:hypothetical protein
MWCVLRVAAAPTQHNTILSNAACCCCVPHCCPTTHPPPAAPLAERLTVEAPPLVVLVQGPPKVGLG